MQCPAKTQRESEAAVILARLVYLMRWANGLISPLLLRSGLAFYFRHTARPVFARIEKLSVVSSMQIAKSRCARVEAQRRSPSYRIANPPCGNSRNGNLVFRFGAECFMVIITWFIFKLVSSQVYYIIRETVYEVCAQYIQTHISIYHYISLSFQACLNYYKKQVFLEPLVQIVYFSEVLLFCDLRNLYAMWFDSDTIIFR